MDLSQAFMCPERQGDVTWVFNAMWKKNFDFLTAEEKNQNFSGIAYLIAMLKVGLWLLNQCWLVSMLLLIWNLLNQNILRPLSRLASVGSSTYPTWAWTYSKTGLNKDLRSEVGTEEWRKRSSGPWRGGDALFISRFLISMLNNHNSCRRGELWSSGHSFLLFIILTCRKARRRWRKI